MSRILLIDENELFGTSICVAMEAKSDLELVRACSLEEADDILSAPEPVDLILLRQDLLGQNSVAAFTSFLRDHPAHPVALVSDCRTSTTLKLMEAGACGLISRSMSLASAISAIQYMLTGARYFPYDLHQALAVSAAKNDLTLRESVTLMHLSQGLSNKEIARQMGLEETTIKLHVKRLISKLGVSNRTQVAVAAIGRQLV